MKFWILGSLFLYFFSLQTFAANTYEAESQILLTYEQFSHLTNAEQKTYVKKLREIINEMSTAFPEIATEMSARSSFFAQIWNLNFQTAFGEINDDAAVRDVEPYIRYANNQASVYAQDVAETDTKNLSEEKKALLLAKLNQAIYWHVFTHEIILKKISDKNKRDELLKKYVTPTQSKIETIEAHAQQFAKEFASEIYRSKAQDYFIRSQDDDLKNNGVPVDALTAYGEELIPQMNLSPIPKTNPQPVTLPISKVETADKKKTDKTETKKVSVRKTIDSDDLPPIPKTNPQPVTLPISKIETIDADKKKTDKIKTKKVSEEKTTGTAKSMTIKDVLYRCMYAGFIIKKGPECMAPSSLPWDLKGLDREKFVCTNDTIMCNPLIFGFKTSCDWNNAIETNKTDTCMEAAAPYCVKKGLYATKNCGSISTSDSALQSAVQLIHNNAPAFNYFSESFTELCDGHMIDLNSYKGTRTPINTQKTKEDIKKTCDSAKVRMAEVRQRFLISNSNKRKKDSSLPAAEKASPNKTAQ